MVIIEVDFDPEAGGKIFFRNIGITYKIIRCHDPENCNINTQRREKTTYKS
jgi:hypothetical protein